MYVIKHLIALLVISIIAVLFIHEIGRFLLTMASFHQFIVQKLSLIFAGDSLGRMIRQVTGLVLIPVVVSLIPAIVYWLIKRGEMPYFGNLIWLLWVMLVTIVAIHHP